MQLRSHRAESSYPPLLPSDSSPSPILPYFNLSSPKDDAASEASDSDPSDDQIRYESHIPQDSPNDSQTESSESSLAKARRGLPTHSSANSPDTGADASYPTSVEGSEELISPPPLEANANDSAQRTSRGRGRGRGRGSLRGLLGSGLGSRGGIVKARGAPRGRPRGRGRASRGEGQRGGGKGSKRGPKAPAEPSEEFKALLAKANSAYIAGNYDIALDLAGQAIQINPEIFAAHNLVSEIYRILGQEEKSLEFLFSGAHTRREPGVWWEVANRTETSSAMSEEAREERLLYCYSRITQIDTDNFDARRRRLTIHMKHDHFGNAIRECRALLRIRPNDLEALQLLAEMCVEARDISPAKRAYENSIQNLQESYPSGPGAEFTFSDLNVYLELFAHLRQYEDGLKTLKSVARWLLGRSDETFWDAYVLDDCEWDLDHQPRRLNAPGFQPDVHPPASYGQSLPLEIRAKIGIFRLKLGSAHLDEAMRHFMLLDPANNSEQAPIFDYPDLFRDVADVLFSCRFFAQALQFFEPLLKTQRFLEREVRRRVAESYRQTSKQNLAVLIYQSLIKETPKNADYLIELARLYEDLGDNSKALECVSQVMAMGKRDAVRRANLKSVPSIATNRNEFTPTEAGTNEYNDAGQSEEDEEHIPASEASEDEDDSEIGRPTRKSRRRSLAKLKPAAERISPLQKAQPDARLTSIYKRINALRPAMRDGDATAVTEWMEGAEMLLQDFRSMSLFFPYEKWVPFLGYSAAARHRAHKMRPGGPPTALEIMASRLRSSLENEDEADESLTVDESQGTPQEYRGISFADWFDIFCEFSFCAARCGQRLKAYEWIEIVKEVNVFYQNDTRNFHIHVVWFVCALLLNDEEAICMAARWFIKAYPAATDGYRLFAALNRLYPGEPNWYHSGPSQKFILRQIKMMDFALLDSDEQRKRFNLSQVDRSGGAFYLSGTSLTQSNLPVDSPSRTMRGGTTSKGDANPHGIMSLDPALLLMYGHILATSGSYRNALNYYFRAYAVDPENAMTAFSISVAFLQLSIKRQAENRQYFVVQALTFFEEYKQLRVRADAEMAAKDVDTRRDVREALRQRKRRVEAMSNRVSEVEYNEGRLWHYLGLMHQAIAAYERCLAIEGHDEIEPDGDRAMNDDSDDDDKLDEPDFKREAAFALQQIYAVSGDFGKAREITEAWLVF